MHLVTKLLKVEIPKLKSTRNSSGNIETVSSLQVKEKMPMEADCVWAIQEEKFPLEVGRLKEELQKERHWRKNNFKTVINYLEIKVFC